MFIPAFMGFSLFLLVSQASSVKAATNTMCGQGVALCCEKDPSAIGQVNDEACQSYSDPCADGYVPSCCNTESLLLEDYYYCDEATTLI